MDLKFCIQEPSTFAQRQLFTRRSQHKKLLIHEEEPDPSDDDTDSLFDDLPAEMLSKGLGFESDTDRPEEEEDELIITLPDNMFPPRTVLQTDASSVNDSPKSVRQAEPFEKQKPKTMSPTKPASPKARSPKRRSSPKSKRSPTKSSSPKKEASPKKKTEKPPKKDQKKRRKGKKKPVKTKEDGNGAAAKEPNPTGKSPDGDDDFEILEAGPDFISMIVARMPHNWSGSTKEVSTKRSTRYVSSDDEEVSSSESDSDW